MTLVDQINQILPQTQCRRCGYAGCLPYAQAMATGTSHNQCPPGGARVIEKLSALLKRDILPLNTAHGIEQPLRWVKIREQDCIGCTKCLQACPTDAIVGALKMMHTVIAKDCTGCELCIAPCPTDCIELYPAPAAEQPALMSQAQRTAQATRFKTKYEQAQARRTVTHPICHTANPSITPTTASGAALQTETSLEKKRAIEAAVLRAKSKKNPQ